MQTIASKNQDLITTKSDDDENMKIACSSYELTPFLVCQSSNDLSTFPYNSVPVINNKSAITTITSTNCNKSRTKGSGFKLNKNLFQNLNSVDYFNNSLWKNIINKKNFNSASADSMMMKSLAEDTLREQQKIRFELNRKLKTSNPSRSSNPSAAKNAEESSAELYVTNGNGIAPVEKHIHHFKTTRRGSGAFKIKPSCNMKAEILKLQKQNRLNQVNTGSPSINEIISITSTNNNNNNSASNLNPSNNNLNPDKMYTKLLAGKSSLNLKSDINLSRKREKTSFIKEPESYIVEREVKTSKFTQPNAPPTRLPILLNKTNTQFIMPQKYLESLEVKKIAPVNKYNIYDFAEIFDSNTELFLDFENNNRLFLPDIQTLSQQATQKAQALKMQNANDCNLNFEQLSLNDLTNPIEKSKIQNEVLLAGL